jgi:hypothetical protein
VVVIIVVVPKGCLIKSLGGSGAGQRAIGKPPNEVRSSEVGDGYSRADIYSRIRALNEFALLSLAIPSPARRRSRPRPSCLVAVVVRINYVVELLYLDLAIHGTTIDKRGLRKENRADTSRQRSLYSRSIADIEIFVRSIAIIKR